MLINGSFEEGPSPGIFLALANGPTAITGWTVVRDNIHYVGTYWPSSHRNRSLDLDGGIAGAIEQSFATTSGQQYTVAFDMVGNPAGPPTIKPMRVSAAGQSQEFTFDTTGRSLTNMGWTPHTWTFTANATTTTLRLESLTAEKRLTQGWGPAVDNIRVGEGCVPPAWEVNAALKWKKDTFNILPASNQILSNPAIIDVNNDGVPDIIFSTFVAPTWWQDGVLRAISGSDGTEIWSVTDPNHEVSGLSSIAVGDIDLDGRPEILAAKEFPSSTVSTQSSVLLAFEHDGTFKWESPPIPDGIGFGGPSIADLEGDGIPEVVVGATVLNNDGTIRWSGTQGHGNNSYGPLSLIADLDLDGHPEIVAGRSAYRANGSIYWNNTSLSDGFPAVGNFDEDPFPEIVLVSRGSVYLLEHTGTIKWGPIVIPGSGNGGPPTVADVDGDGQPEIGVAGANRYVVLETNGTIKWQVVIQDVISSVTGSSVFDFEGDGTAEVIYGDELFLRVFRGSDGTELFKFHKSSCTAYEMPLVADVDKDGHAEIVTIANAFTLGGWCGSGPERGIYVFGSADNNWVSTRKIWNQHTYHITNINEDGTIPRVEQNNWLVPGLNNFRLNTFSSNDQSRTDSFTYKANDGSLDSNVATVYLTVEPPNHPPTISSSPITQAIQGQLYSYDVEATDPDTGNVLTYSLSTAPAGMTMNATSGVIQWTPTSSQTGNQNITVRVQDAGGLFDVQSFTLAVTPASQAVAVPNVVGLPQTAAETTITTAQLTVGTVSTAPSPTVPAGNVISQDPTAGTVVVKGSAE